MGCDIHTYLEYQVADDYWRCLISNGGSRDYSMFGILAGVRCDGCHIPPRGMPEGRLSWEVREAASVRIAADETQKDWEGYCTREQAKQWGEPIFEEGGTKYIRNPDWHSHSWLTADELADCLAKYMFNVGECCSVEWDATLAAMRALEDRGYKTRLTFWFDN